MSEPEVPGTLELHLWVEFWKKALKNYRAGVVGVMLPTIEAFLEYQIEEVAEIADRIETERRAMALTPEQREALEWAISLMENAMRRDSLEAEHAASATLRAMLDQGKAGDVE